MGSDFLDMSMWFSHEPRHDTLYCEPRTKFPLLNGFDIFVERRSHRRPAPGLNETIQDLFSLEWEGNIVVCKRSRKDHYSAAHMTPSDVSLVSILIRQ